MQQKNTFLMLTLSGSILMMMLVSVLFSVPTPSGLQASITPNKVFTEIAIPTALSRPVSAGMSTRNPQDILRIIEEYVEGNDPDTAKKLYDELYRAQQYADNVMRSEAAKET